MSDEPAARESQDRVPSFTPVPASALFSVDRPEPPPGDAMHPAIVGAIQALPGGDQTLWGIPFEFASVAATPAQRWLSLPTLPRADVAIDGALADWIVFAHFSTGPGAAMGNAPGSMIVNPGVRLAAYSLIYADAVERRVPIRRRFEINDVVVGWGQAAFASLPHRDVRSREGGGPHAAGEWGSDQTGVQGGDYVGLSLDEPTLPPFGNYWLFALRNPRPLVALTGLRLEAATSDWIAIGAITLVRSASHPLRRARLLSLVVESGASDPPPAMEVKLGEVARTLDRQPTNRRSWLRPAVVGWGDEHAQATSTDRIVQVAAAEAGAVMIAGASASIAKLARRRHTRLPNGIRFETLPEPMHLVSFEVRDSETGALTPSRVHARTRQGRYLPPVGHRQVVNDRWFEDFAADLKLGGTQYAYVPGSFQIRVPTDDVFVEVVKGFEYEPVRLVVKAATISADPVVVHMERTNDVRRQGWIAADTHVHFLSPETAWLEGQAEGLSIVNLLAAQWGDLYTNVGDVTGELSMVSRDGTLVWVGTENRQHIMGHMSLLGTNGRITAPLSSAGPDEAYLGDAAWTSLSEWADDSRRQGGLAVIPHFPNPYCEVVADVALGRVDALEVRDFWSGVDSHATREWYRLLNSGLRVPIVGGTDKMSAGMPIGGLRTYAQVGTGPTSWEGWTEAVRSGRTSTSSGPFIDLSVEGMGLGGEIVIGPGASLGVHATARCVAPLDRLELVYNGRVVEATTEPDGNRFLELKTTIRTSRGGWIAARTSSPFVAQHVWPVQMAAHTSPIYLVGDRHVDARDDIAYLRTIVAGGLTWLDTLATRGDRSSQRRIRTVFNSADHELRDLARRNTG
jgi:hypothetical protein